MTDSLRNTEVIFASGFTEKPHLRWSGIGQLHVDLEPVMAASPGVRVRLPQLWKSSAKELARKLHTFRPHIGQVFLVCHSWGLGNFGRTFCEELRKLFGYTVRVVIVAADGVWRNRLLPTWLPVNASTLFSKRVSIKLPDNVDRVVQFRQREGIPYGSPIKIESHPSGTRIEYVEVEGVKHTAMDETVEFRERVLEEWKNFIGGETE
ncbi:MAG: hypothetical protein AAF555_05660 [Verrucomicrobiota bacterium]